MFGATFTGHLGWSDRFENRAFYDARQLSQRSQAVANRVATLETASDKRISPIKRHCRNCRRFSQKITLLLCRPSPNPPYSKKKQDILSSRLALAYATFWMRCWSLRHRSLPQRYKANPRNPSADAILALTEKLSAIEATGATDVDFCWLNNNYQRALFHYVRRCFCG